MFKSRLLQTSRRSLRRFMLAACLLIIFAASAVVEAQTPGHDREMGRTMLGVIKNDIKKNYYDASFHGLDLDAHFKAAEEKLKQAASVNEVLGVIASTVMELNDSHTYFVPPMRATRVEHGWQMQMIGDKCYIVAVQPGGDAEAKGLKPGDRVVSRDPVLAHAARLAGLDITPEKAGALFPVEWRK